MQLTIKLKKRWITSVLAESKKAPPPMPWQRARGGKPASAAPRPVLSGLAEARG